MKFGKILEKLAYRHRIMEVFDDFLQMSICALTLGKMEQEYMDIVRRYEKNEVQIFCEAFGQMMLDYEEINNSGSWEDPFGKLFMEYNSDSTASSRGQFFTPEHICDLMANIAKEDSEKEEISILDCAVGSGRTLIAHRMLAPENRFKTFYIGQDLDSRCVKMCTLNYFLFGMRGIVIHMDSIRMEVYSGYRVYLPDTCMGILPLTKEQCLPYIMEEVKKPVRVSRYAIK